MSSTKTVVPTPTQEIGLTLQTGMPPIYHSRSRELNYDVLITQPDFQPNPFGPQLLVISRPEHHW
jgi:hypothetical protein